MKFFGKQLMAACICCGLLTGCNTSDVVDQAANVAQAEDEHVLAVKNGEPEVYPGQTFGEAFDKFFSAPTWKYFVGTKEGPDDDGDGEPDYTEDNIEIVEFTGYCTYADVNVKALIQFTLDEDDEGEYFEPTYLSFNEVPQNGLMMWALLETVFEDEDEADTAEGSAEPEPVQTEKPDEPEPQQEATPAANEYIIPDSSIREYLDKDIRSMELSKEELRIARNEIYARHGRKFKDAGLQAHFNSCSWYKGTIEPDAFDESVLSDVERFNIESIATAEEIEYGTISKDWYLNNHYFYNEQTGVFLEIAWWDDGTLQIIPDGTMIDMVSAQSGTSYNTGLRYVCDDGTIFNYYPNHHGEIHIENGVYAGVYYPN